MAVVASFTFVQTGTTTVAFTDTSTGSPNRWLWEFGDGFTSGQQNPAHSYAAQGSYSVKLTAFVQSGTTNVGHTFVSGRTKNAGPSPTAIGAYNAFIAKPWSASGSFSLRYNITYLGGFVIFGGESTLSWNLGAHPSGVAELQVFIFPLNNPSGSSIKSGSGDLLDTSVPTGWTAFKNVRDKLGTTFQETLTDASGYTFDGLEFFIQDTRVVVWTATDIDTDTQSVSVSPLSVDFVGTPVFGTNVQTVNFRDLSSDGVTAWSWRKRKAGTSDSFVEFSTLENPSHNFDKDNP